MKEQMSRETETLNERDEELRIAHTQAQREKRMCYASQLFDAVFEIANEAYIH